jgi:hypothetical protein
MEDREFAELEKQVKRAVEFRNLRRKHRSRQTQPHY